VHFDYEFVLRGNSVYGCSTGSIRFRVDNGELLLCICFARELGLGLFKEEY
jgi:hypothetical protein